VDFEEHMSCEFLFVGLLCRTICRSEVVGYCSKLDVAWVSLLVLSAAEEDVVVGHMDVV